MGKILIAKISNDLISTSLDFKGMTRGEVAHFMAEIDLVKKKLLDKWEKMEE